MENKIDSIVSVFKKYFPLVEDGTIQIKAMAVGYGCVLLAFHSNNPSIEPLNIITRDIDILEKIETEIGDGRLNMFIWKEDQSEFLKGSIGSLFGTSSIDLDTSKKIANIKITSVHDFYLSEEEATKLISELTGWQINILK